MSLWIPAILNFKRIQIKINCARCCVCHISKYMGQTETWMVRLKTLQGIKVIFPSQNIKYVHQLHELFLNPKQKQIKPHSSNIFHHRNVSGNFFYTPMHEYFVRTGHITPRWIKKVVPSLNRTVSVCKPITCSDRQLHLEQQNFNIHTPFRIGPFVLKKTISLWCDILLHIQMY